MQRRSFLGMLGLMSLSVAAPADSSGAGLVAAWRRWKTRFLEPEGRVVDPEQAGISHSEGQGYALLLAQGAGDRDAFERIEAWTRAHLLIREDALMAWRWTPGGGVMGEDWHNATDGDLFRAWALLRARRDSGWPVEQDIHSAITADISGSCLWPDPRAGAELLLRPSAEALATEERVLLNPSYIMPRALRELGTDTGDTRLVRAADHGETCLAELAATGLLPDWIDVTARGYESPTGHDLRSAYDALRIPLYLVWSGRDAHAAVRLAASQLAPDEPSGAVTVARGEAGEPTATSDLPGYRAVARLAACSPVEPPGAPSLDGPYYPAALHMLAALAARENSACAPPK
ncbi:glycosyl hydrolase family 8 [Roseivivax sediminis]|uniref:cellulase n=1 Tax=Roseivivax sediminis TaxID=936889 RepID=A0A1I2EL92_9RHOB|nr:glycosyl hydrolase family 8 [Roseivivax sediminis]SFE93635.1 endoglucanase [Roseivivax sediminis]